MNRVLLGLLSIILFIIGLFWYQNSTRLPMLDTGGNYLSLDLYFWGVAITQPISIPTLMGISFIIGGIVFSIATFLMRPSEEEPYLS
jgi:hypothetical protein